MVTVFNTRAESAGRNAKYAILLSALSLLVIIALISWSRKYPASRIETDPCSGYGGLPSHQYIGAIGDSASAETRCRKDRPLLGISVKHKHYIALQQKRLEALETGVLLTSDADFVPARINFKGKNYKAKIRLKGDWTDHVSAATRWSFRIVLSGDSYILGRQRFSLQSFAARNNDKDPLYALHLAAIGLMTPRYKPVTVEFNGQDWGTMVIEDHFNRELMEARSRKESVIGRFDESDMWRHRYQYPEFDPYDNVYTALYKSFNGRAIRKSATLTAYDRYTRSVMSAWQEGRVPLASIIDLEKFADFIVASEAWSGYHTFRWHNMRFYLNPYTMKLEPVPFDNGWFLWDISAQSGKARVSESQVLAELLDSGKFREVLGSRLQALLVALQEKSVWTELRRSSNYLATLLRAEGGSAVISLGLLKRNLDYLESSGVGYFDEAPLSMDVPEQDMHRQFHTQVKVSAYSNGLVSLLNKLPFPLEVKDIRLYTKFSSSSIISDSKEPIRLPATALRSRPEAVNFQLAEIEPGTRVTVTSLDPATGSPVEDSSAELLDYINAADLQYWSPMDLPGTVSLPEFVVVTQGQWRIPGGNWVLRQPLVVPAGVVLNIEPGAVISVDSKGFILCRGALNLLGSAQRPVILQAYKSGFWNGIYLLNPDQPSLWRHAVVRDTGPFSFHHFQLSGAINFYRSDIRLEHVSLENVAAEDAINLVESRFVFENLSLVGTGSDAIDADFSSGRISASAFRDIGGDAIDTSGSELELRDIQISSVTDKAISIGEASRVSVYDARIADIGVGVAVKDYSRARIEGLDIRRARVAAVMAYNKKAEYGGVLLEIVDFHTEDVEQEVINQLDSTVLIEGSPVPSREVNVDYYYRSGLMPK